MKNRESPSYHDFALNDFASFCGGSMARIISLLLVALAACAHSEDQAEAEIKAHISFPFDRGMVRANVPVFGVAWAEDFESYRVEFGEGPKPEGWTLIHESRTPQPTDPWAKGRMVWNPDWGAQGNLATWETGLDEYPYGKEWKHNLRGLHTLRLVVKTRDGRTAEHRIEVTVARVVTNWSGGYAESPDKLVRFQVGADSLTGAFVLVSLLPCDKVPAPEDYVPIGSVYEFRPPNLKFLRPAQLTFHYGPEALGAKRDEEAAVPADKLAVFAYDAKARLWRPLVSTVDAENREVSAPVIESPHGVAYYGLFADLAAPTAPVLDPLGDRVQRSVVKVTGKSEPGATVVLTLNGEETEVMSGDNGRFVAEVRARPGKNALRAVGRDHAGNVSESSPEHTFTLDPKHPKRASEITILGGKEAVWGRKLLVKLVGEDASPETDVTHVRIASAETDPEGFVVDTVETGPDTGVYVALFEVSSASDPIAGRIGATKDGEAIVVSWLPEPEVRASKVFHDRVPPAPPVVVCEAQPVLVANSFEEGPEKLGQWAHYGGEEYAARLEVIEEEDKTFLRARGRGNQKGHLGVSAWRTEYSVVEYPVLSFDCRVLPTTEVDVLVYVSQPSVGWKGIRLTDDHPYYPRIGQFFGVLADLQWRRASVNLLHLLRGRYPGQSDYRVREIAFADWNGGDRLFGTKFFGNSSIMGGYFDIDNFVIGKACSADKITFRWLAEDPSGIEGYSMALDDQPETVAPETMCEYSPYSPQEAKPTDAPEEGVGEGDPEPSGEIAWSGEKAYAPLQDGRWWFHIRAKDRCGNWGRPNHYLLVIDTQPPELELLTPRDEKVRPDDDIRFRLSDQGAGLDLHTLELEVDGRRLKVDGRSLRYDFYRKQLRLRLPFVQPFPLAFVDGAPLSLTVHGVRDLAGNQLDTRDPYMLKAGSSVSAAKGSRLGKAGWFLEEPKLALHPLDRDEYELRWMRSLKGDKLAEAGCSVRELGIFPVERQPTKPEAGRATARPEGEPARYVVEVKVDRTTPETAIELRELPPTEALESRPLITLRHGEYVWRRGGFLGQYFRGADFSEPIIERTDPFVYFVDDREQFSPVVPGAQSAAWEGAIYVSETRKLDLELALWNRAPASGSLEIDGDLILELRPEEMGAIGFKKKSVLLTEGLHELRMQYAEPSGRPWRFALFVWGKTEREQDERRVFGPEELFHRENLGTTYCRWNDQPFQVYTSPFPALPGKNVLRYYTVDQAGNKEPVKTREFHVRNIIEAELELEGGEGE